ncbi:HD domain-containing protein [Poseidonibacter ostreae]|nr:HD domain-containing protein [Poseidonibacter ostreae]
MIELVVKFLYRYKYVRILLKQTIFYFLLMYFFGLLLNLYLTKELDLNFFNWIDSFHYNPTAIILILVGITLCFFTITLYFYTQLNHNKKIEIKLEDIAHIWTNEIEEVEKERIVKEYNHSPFLIRAINDKIYNSKRIQRFNSENIISNIRYFKDEELYIINEVLAFLDNNLKVSSVPSYNADTENTYINDQNYFKEFNTGKSNVKLLSQISLVEHTINVVTHAIEEFRKIENEGEFSVDSLKLSTVIISALSHDIGKIINNNFLKEIGLDEVIVKDMNHTDISIAYFKNFIEKIGNFDEKEMISKSIKEHHGSTLPSDKLSKLIFIADKEARKKESRELIIELKQAAQEKIEKYEREKKLSDDKIQNDKLKKQLEEKNALIKELENEKKISTAQEEIVAINEEEYNKAKSIVSSEVINKVENDKERDTEKLIEFIKKNINRYTKRGDSLVLREKDLIDNPKDFLKSISDEENIYFTYQGIKEVFEHIEEKKLAFNDMKDHNFFKILKELEIIHFYNETQFYKKFNINYINVDEKLSNVVSLIKMPMNKLNIDIENMIEEKMNSPIKKYFITEANK